MESRGEAADDNDVKVDDEERDMGWSGGIFHFSRQAHFDEPLPHREDIAVGSCVAAFPAVLREQMENL